MILNFIKNLVNNGNTTEVRGELSSPAHLRIGDIVEFTLLAQAELSRKKFQVNSISTYDFKQETYTTFSLIGENNAIIDLTLRSLKGKETLMVRKLMTREQVGMLFDLDAFAQIFEEGNDALVSKTPLPAFVEHWAGHSYHEAIDCRKGYKHEGDYRNRPLPEYEEDSIGMDYYLLIDDTESYFIEAEVFDQGETDIYVAVSLPLSSIEALWPGN